MKPVIRIIAGVFAATSAVTGVSYAQSYRIDAAPSHEYRHHASLGVVESVETLQGTNQGNKVAGTILGSVLGGVIGHQFGSGRGNDAATVAGALGGAAVGHNIGENRGSRDSYRVSVRMDNGEYRVVQQDDLNGLRTGDRVRVDGDHVTLFAGNERYAPPEAYVPPEQRQEVYDADQREDYRPEYRPEYRPSYQPAYQPDDRGYRYDRDGNVIDDTGYRYRN